MNMPTPTHPSIRLFNRYLREQGLPITHQRNVVAAAVFGSDDHLSVDDIERVLREGNERIGKATIYRTLDLMVKSRLVEEHDFGEGFKRYEHRLTRQPIHQHLVCTECGDVEEFGTPEIPAIEARVAREFGFRPIRHRLEIYGLCRSCVAAGVTAPRDGLACPIETV